MGERDAGGHRSLKVRARQAQQPQRPPVATVSQGQGGLARLDEGDTWSFQAGVKGTCRGRFAGPLL